MNQITSVTSSKPFFCIYLFPNNYDESVLQIKRYVFSADAEIKFDLRNKNSVDINTLPQIIKSIVPDNCYLYNDSFNSDESKNSSTYNIKERNVFLALTEYGVNCRGYPFIINTENLLKELSTSLDNKLKRYEGISLIETKLKENSSTVLSWKKSN